ncbi:glycosyltransferase family 25 protein [Pseudooceanicola sp. HF7]|uniref:glycosyltransferase family 25 protein n=1 Tax=Pseudooceanicola sp. HF7 TaxID=2721560 RepID=UPI00143174E5|nr:glycosyltransferase family 25 protein [Pseudooceanicola sp. HF7]NIZ08905.1 glycosyltransferase family 25 protein [Pseudooceanicola sp. HF7]
MTPSKIPALVINLASQVERMALMTRQLDMLGLPIQRIEAVTPPTTAAMTQAIGARFAEGMLSETEIAVFLSQMSAWKWIAESGHEWGLVLEDDVLFSRDARAGIDFAAARATKGMVRIEAWRDKRQVVGRGTVARQRGGFRIYDYHHGAFGAAGYLLRADLARELLARDTLLSVPVDLELFDMDHGARPPCQVLYPAVAVQSDKVHELKLKPGSPWARAGLPVFETGIEHTEHWMPDTTPKKAKKGLGDLIRAEWESYKWRQGFKRQGMDRMRIPLSESGPLLD